MAAGQRCSCASHRRRTQEGEGQQAEPAIMGVASKIRTLKALYRNWKVRPREEEGAM